MSRGVSSRGMSIAAAGDTPAAPSAATRARAFAALAAFAALVLVVAAVPLMVSPPVGLTLAGPSVLPAGQEVSFEGRLTLAGVGMGGADVDVTLDGAPLRRLTTAADGSFVVTLEATVPGRHVLRAYAAPGTYLEAQTGELAFDAVLPPPPPTDARAQLDEGARVLRWTPAAPDDERPVQAWRVYAREPGTPWREVATLAADATGHPIDAASGREFAVAAANVAGESAWVTVRA